MADSRTPLFLERRTYRRRRLTDAVRLLPVLGVLVFMLPLLGMSGGGGRTMRGGVLLFAAWFALIVLTALLSRKAERPDVAAGDGDRGNGDDRGSDSGSDSDSDRRDGA